MPRRGALLGAGQRYRAGLGGGGVSAPTLSWMVIDAASTAELATAKAAGANCGLVQVFWDQCQSTNGGAVDASGTIANIQRIVDAGMSVTLRVSLQYIPTFVDTAAVKFRRNGAVDWNPGNVSGNNARDWVWSSSTRALVDDFLTKLFNQLDWTKINRVQLGGGPAGELNYPNSDGTQWWGSSAPAQTGTGLASGQTVCPSPGYVPSTGTTWTATDIAWASWYTQSLNNWMLWLIAKHRAYYSGPIWVMHPGSGLRKVSQTPTGTYALAYRQQVAMGVDWDSQIAAYPDSNVHPYSTWSDGVHNWDPDPYSDVNDGNAAAWYHLLRVARARGRATKIWGENTGDQTTTDLDRIFASGSVALGYQGLVWLNHAKLIAGGAQVTYAQFGAKIAAAGAASGTYRSGVNMAGGEFSPAAATLPGTYSTDYSYDSATAFAAIGARGHKIVRVPFRWERIQPTRNAALNSAELTRLQQVVTDAVTGGMTVILDCHNYGRYINSVANGGATLVLADTLPVADLVDLWTRLSTAFKANAGVYAYAPMNEPNGFVAPSGSFSGTTRYDWASGVQGWTGDSATASNVSGKLRLSSTATSGNYNFRKDDAATVTGGSTPTGVVLQFECTLVTNPGGTWIAKAQWQNDSFQWQNPTSVTYTRVDTGATVTGLISGVAVRVASTFASINALPKAFLIQVESANATAGSVVVDIDNFAQGSVGGSGTAAEVWETASQQVVTAVRGNADTKKILVAGYNWSGAKSWRTSHPDPWITDSASNFAYEAHYYFDVDNSGDYPDSYTTENAAAVSAGYASLASRAVTELQNWTSWLAQYGVRGFLGEIGWPNNADTASWNAVGEALYTECDQHAVGVAYWAAGARWGTSYNLSAYTGANQDTVKSPASVIEAHPLSAGSRIKTGGAAARCASSGARGGPSIVLFDNFSTENSTYWSNYADADISATGGRLSIVASAAYPSMPSTRFYDLTGGYLSFELVQTITTNASGVFVATVAPSTGNEVQWRYTSGFLSAWKVVATVETEILSTTYNATNHRWLRIREAAGTTYWETSTAGITWTAFTSQSNPVPLATARAIFGAGHWDGLGAGTALIDNVTVFGQEKGAIGAPSALVPYGPSGTWTKVFEDNFSGASLDLTRWSPMNNATMNGTTTLATNVTVSGGEAQLTLSDSTHGAFISSAPADGAGVNGWTLPVGGVCESRVYFPGNGTNLYNWSAWWASGPNWASNGEHDIAEILGESGGVLTVNYHYGLSPSDVGVNQRPNPPGYWGDAFHIYTLHRKATTADVYWDGQLVHSYATNDLGGGEALLLNVGNGAGPTVAGVSGAMRVDYVRGWIPG